MRLDQVEVTLSPIRDKDGFIGALACYEFTVDFFPINKRGAELFYSGRLRYILDAAQYLTELRSQYAPYQDVIRAAESLGDELRIQGLIIDRTPRKFVVSQSEPPATLLQRAREVCREADN